MVFSSFSQFPRRSVGALGAACGALGAIGGSRRKAPTLQEERLTPYERSQDFPPSQLEGDDAAVARWFEQVFCTVPPKQPDPTDTPRERALYAMSARDYVEARRNGRVTCEEYARALVKRARYYRCMNQWVYRSYDLFDKMVEQARVLDQRAAVQGIEAIAPLYGLPIPMKGTASVIDYPSGSGCGVLSGYTPVRDSKLTQLIKEKGGLIFGTTNVPEFAASYQTCNRASGQTRNVYGHHLTVGGSSGGSGSAVAGYMCPVAVTEDTGGSTRSPATCNQNFGFDPSRNHWANDGNPGMSFTCDQLGLNARSVEDLLFCAQCLQSSPASSRLHAEAKLRCAALPADSIRVGCPLVPFVQTLLREGLHGAGDARVLNADVREKYNASKHALSEAGFAVLNDEWPSAYFDYLGRVENVALEACYSKRPVNGKPLPDIVLPFLSFSGQVAEFVRAYLDAPVSLKEIIQDIGSAGRSYSPGQMLQVAEHLDETQFRYFMGPKIKADCEAYNSYFDQTGADLILIPAARAATPDLAACAAGSIPLTVLREDGSSAVEETGHATSVFMDHMFRLKHLHIPKLLVPTGLTHDGRPTAVQLWGRAVPYEQMFEDGYSARHDAEFLYMAQRVASAIQAKADLQRVDAPVVASELGLAAR